jgi:hypothetical protein
MMEEGTRLRIVRTLGLLVADARHRFDDCRNNIEAGSQGGYSPELTEAINLLSELEAGACEPDESVICAAYKKGFADAKRQILAELEKMR